MKLRDALAQTNHKFPDVLVEVPKSAWPPDLWLVLKTMPFKALRSRDFLVQLYTGRDGIVRMTVNRTVVNADDEFTDGITWDDLMRLKREAGYGECDAVEVLPRDCDVVNVKNMRHIFIYPGIAPLAFIWRKEPGSNP